MTDSDADVRWMSYAEAAILLGVNPESVARRMRRDNWVRRRGNDGKPRVAVPIHLLPTSPAIRVTVPDGVPDSVPENTVRSAPSVLDINRPESPDTASLVLALTAQAARAEGEAAALRERAEMAEARVEKAEARADAAQALADQRGQELAELRERAGRAEGEAVALRQPFWRRWIG